MMDGGGWRRYCAVSCGCDCRVLASGLVLDWSLCLSKQGVRIGDTVHGLIRVSFRLCAARNSFRSLNIFKQQVEGGPVMYFRESGLSPDAPRDDVG